MRLGMMTAALLLFWTAAAAADNTRYMDQIQQYNQRIMEMRQTGADGAVGEALSKAETWLQSAQSKIAEDELGEAEVLLRRTAVQLDYAEAEVEIAQLERRAGEREAEAEKAEANAKELEVELRQMREREAELKAKISALGGAR